MTKEEINVQIALGTYLPTIWKERCKIVNEGYELIDEGHRLRGYELICEGNKLLIDAIKEVKEVYDKDTKAEWINGGMKINGAEYYNDIQ